MAMSELELKLVANERYYRSVRQAEIGDYWARISGQNNSLLKYEEVAARLHIRQQIPLGYQMVKLTHIVGSLGRYREFTRGFAPRPAILRDRWVAVDVTMNSLRGLPPVALYKIGQAYFVIDGNHRISVAHANGSKDIEANVIEWQTNVEYTLEDFSGDGWAVKAAYYDFLTETHLQHLRPTAELPVSCAEHYQTLLHHIEVHRYLINQPRSLANPPGRTLSWEEAVASWYDTIYLPVVQAARTHKLCERFPKHIETDLYIAITCYREEVAATYALAPLGAETAVTVFAAGHSERIVDRSLHALRHVVSTKVPWHWWRSKLPPGMTVEDFGSLRLRHAAGELSLGEAARHGGQMPRFSEAHCDSTLSAQFSG
jgi:hypothetical protein